ncbi:MAG: hypothetical protein NC123_03470 [Butyrivibrio sp.]|nr:hypothetical protein [Acetatifactor muris]MCM1558596.1 hypothetical protein [Butyrivibrio sp.]
MESKAKGRHYLVFGIILEFVGIVVTVISIIVTVISIRQTGRNEKHQKSRRKIFRISATDNTPYSFYGCKDHTPNRMKGE